MSVAQYFLEFSTAIAIPAAKRDSIAYRSGRLTRQLNSDFRNSTSDCANRFYAGSYGRNTAIPTVSDIDMMYVLPYSAFEKYNGYASNGQSALLQAVRQSIDRTYPSSAIIADGQIVCIKFNDGLVYEIVPVFLNNAGGYTFADSKGGGSWKSCKPKQEIDEFAARDTACNFNLVQLARMVRAWRDHNAVPMSGMLIDTLAYQFIMTWAHKDKSFLYYDYLTRDFFNFLANQSETQSYWLAPGSGSYVWRTGKFEYKARVAELRALEAIKHLEAQELWAARQKYREIYGTSFPS
jgi:hypothetical protein